MRKKRLLLPGAFYHVTMRVNHHEMKLEQVVFKNLYLKVVAEAKRKYSFRIENFCIMDNHVHLLIKPGNGSSLSRIMQWINGVFAMRYNRMMGIDGSFWGERFYSVLLPNLNAFLHAFEYIDQNPVMAHLVKEATNWLFGGARHRAEGYYTILDLPG